MEEMKKCPFCGCEPRKLTSRKEGDLMDLHRVYCSNILCPVQPATRRRKTMQEAIDNWNGRANV